MSEMWGFLCLGTHKSVIIQEYDFIQGSVEPCSHTYMQSHTYVITYELSSLLFDQKA